MSWLLKIMSDQLQDLGITFWAQAREKIGKRKIKIMILLLSPVVSKQQTQLVLACCLPLTSPTTRGQWINSEIRTGFCGGSPLEHRHTEIRSNCGHVGTKLEIHIIVSFSSNWRNILGGKTNISYVVYIQKMTAELSPEDLPVPSDCVSV